MPEPSDLKYSRTHEWARVEGDIATIGITNHAQEELGDVVTVLLPEVGRALQLGDKLGEIESIKAVSDLYAPVSGVVVAVNDALMRVPELVNDDPYGEGWMVRLQMTQPAETELLMDSAAYDALIGES